MLETWRRIVTDSSDIVHSQPVPLVLPHPSLPGDNILTLRWFFEKTNLMKPHRWALSIVFLSAMLWMNCSILACIPQYRNSTCNNPCWPRPTAQIHKSSNCWFVSQSGFSEVNAERRRREILDGFTKGTHARHDPKFELKFFHICKWKKDLCQGIGTWGLNRDMSQMVVTSQRVAGGCGEKNGKGEMRRDIVLRGDQQGACLLVTDMFFGAGK